MIGKEIDSLIRLLSRLPGVGKRSARRMVIQLLQQRESLMHPLSNALKHTADIIVECEECQNLDTVSPCSICRDIRREKSVICVVEQISDLWALEKTSAFKGTYHVLGGVLSALDNRGPEDLAIFDLIQRANKSNIKEVIIALNPTIDGQTTAYYLMERLQHSDVEVTRLAHGVPVGAELGYLDDGTLTTALRARSAL